jgi:hypothetical protein
MLLRLFKKILLLLQRAGNLFLFKNFKHEQFVNFITSGIKQNKFETRVEQLESLKTLKENEFQQMFGIPATQDSRRDVHAIVDKMVSNANHINEVTKRVNRTFTNPFEFKGTGNYKNQEQAAAQAKINEQHVAYEGVKEQLVYAMSVTKDSADRIADLRNKINNVDGRVGHETIEKLSSDKGLKELKKEYQDTAKDLQESLKLQKDAKVQRELDWHLGRIDDINSALEEKDKTKAVKSYNDVIKSVFSKAVAFSDNKTPIDGLTAKEMMDYGKDIFYLQKRNEIAIDNYATLTTKGGFKKMFGEIMDLRKKANETPVNIAPEKSKDALGQAEALAQLQTPAVTPTVTPTKTTQQAAPNNGMVNSQELEETTEAIPETMRIKLNALVVKIIDGKYKATELELGHLGFKTIADLQFETPGYDLKEYDSVKSLAGVDYYIKKDVVKNARVIAAKGDTVVENTPATGGNIPENIIDSTNPPANNPPTGGPTGKGNEPMHVDDFLAKILVPKDLRAAFNAVIFSGTKDEVRQHLSITVRPLSPELQAAYDNQKASGTYTPYTGYPGVFTAKAPIELSIAHKGNTIGYVSYPERLLFKVGNSLVTMDKLTAEQYANFTGRPAAQYAADLQEYNRQVAFKNYLALRYRENGMQPVTLSAEELSAMLDVHVGYGEFDLVTNDADRPQYRNLAHNKVKFTAPDGTQQETFAIVSIPKTYVGDEGTRERTENMTTIYGANFYASGAFESGVDELIRQAPEALVKLGSRYVGVVQLPDGSYSLIALRPGTMAEGSREQMFQDIKAQATASIQNAVHRVNTREEADYTILYGEQQLYYALNSQEAKSYNDAFNNELNNRTFIADVNGKMWFNISVSPMGAARLEVFEPHSNYSTTIFVSPQKIQELNSFNDFVAILQGEIAKKAANDSQFRDLKVTINVNSFKQNVPKDRQVDADNLANLLTAAVTTNVTKNSNMKLMPNPSGVTEATRALRTPTAPVEGHVI